MTGTTGTRGNRRSSASGPGGLGRLPRLPGVYRFRDAAGRVLYVGRATSLRSRVPSYWSQLGQRAHLTQMVARIASVEAVCCGSVHEAAWLERNVLERSLPPWNRTPGGQESAVYIRLDTGPAQPGLRIVYQVEAAEDVRHFGPYLGGLRVRQAVAALHRIAPLRYAAARLAGADRDMATLRGVRCGDRAELARSIMAILNREAVAVGQARAQLEQLRADAARVQAYELAAKIQAEIGALNWVCCPQRVTTMTATNHAIAGWSDGMLVEFQIIDGLLCGWSQRSCELPEASAALVATPASWRDFTQQNAALAASLARP
jgi:excinuclease ABC subunit C